MAVLGYIPEVHVCKPGYQEVAKHAKQLIGKQLIDPAQLCFWHSRPGLRLALPLMDRPARVDRAGACVAIQVSVDGGMFSASWPSRTLSSTIDRSLSVSRAGRILWRRNSGCWSYPSHPPQVLGCVELMRAIAAFLDSSEVCEGLCMHSGAGPWFRWLRPNKAPSDLLPLDVACRSWTRARCAGR
jgi:hypothetical protein